MEARSGYFDAFDSARLGILLPRCKLLRNYPQYVSFSLIINPPRFARVMMDVGRSIYPPLHLAHVYYVLPPRCKISEESPPNYQLSFLDCGGKHYDTAACGGCAAPCPLRAMISSCRFGLS